jgi:hypothetical protein
MPQFMNYEGFHCPSETVWANQYLDLIHELIDSCENQYCIGFPHRTFGILPQI